MTWSPPTCRPWASSRRASPTSTPTPAQRPRRTRSSFWAVSESGGPAVAALPPTPRAPARWRL
eukprot:11223119-Lingulodinium_polyedra.AAC.1